MQSLIVQCKLQSTNHSFSVPERLSGSCRVGCWSDDWIALWGDWHLISQWPNNSPEIRNYYHIPITSVISPDLIFSVLVYQWYSYSYIYIYHPPGARDRAPCTKGAPRTASCSHGPVYGYNCFRPQATMSLSDYSELHGGRLGTLAGKS